MIQHFSSLFQVPSVNKFSIDPLISPLHLSRACQRNHWPNHKGLCRPNMENVGLPFLVSVPESRLTYTRLTQLLEGYSR